MLEIKPLFGLPLDFPHTNLDFLHTNLVPSSTYKEVDRFTNERHSTTMKTIGLSRFARALLIRIGSCRIYSIFQIKAGRFRKRYRSCNRFAGKIYLRDFQFIRNRFIVKMACLTVKDIEGALNVCVTVRDWGTLTKSIQIPQVMALASLARPGLPRSWPGLPGKRGLEMPGKPGQGQGFEVSLAIEAWLFRPHRKIGRPFNGLPGQ